MQKRKGIVKMSIEELRKLEMIYKVLDRRITQKLAASNLDLSERQIRRIVKRVKEKGDTGIVHRSRGKPSKRKIPNEVRGRIISIYEKNYLGFGPTFATEKLLERDKIQVSREALRKLLMKENVKKSWKKM